MRTLLVFTLMFCTFNTYAADGYVEGLGTKTCDEVMTGMEKKEPSQQDVINWTLGYFSGANVAHALHSRRDVTAGSAILTDRLMSLVKAKCDDHPDYLLSKAVYEVYFELRTAGQ